MEGGMTMKVYGTVITDEQLEAGRKAMRGRFTMADIIDALMAAGVPEMDRSLSMQLVAHRAAEQIFDGERKAGKIRHIGGGAWERGA